ncbi:MAG: alpha/beta fold hydrolase [Myxococcota bacterium]
MPHIDVQGRKLYYESHGNHAGTPLVLAMGVGGSCQGWLPLQVPEFSKDRTTVIFDYPGVGQSEAYDGAFSTADLADTLDAFLSALSIPKADVLGAFMGGMVAQELALRHADRVSRLVLVGSYARADAKRRLLLQHWIDLARGGASLETLVRDRLLWTAHDATIEQTDLIDAMVEFFTRDGAPLSAEVFALQCEACLAHDTRTRLPKIAAPALVVSGGADLLTPPKLALELTTGLADARLATLSQAAHLVMVEAVESFNRTVLQFLEDGH